MPRRRAGAGLITTATVPVLLDVDDTDLPDDIAVTAYFVVVEAVTNALKHGDPGRVVIRVRRDGQALHVRVDDDGVGVSTRRDPVWPVSRIGSPRPAGPSRSSARPGGEPRCGRCCRARRDRRGHLALPEGLASLLIDDGHDVVGRAADDLEAVVAAMPWHSRELVALGGFGYLLKDRVLDVDDFLGALDRVAASGTALDPLVVERLLGRRSGADGILLLTPREREVLALMAEGRTNTAIAARMWLTDRTVETHVRNILTKLDLADNDDNRRVLAVLQYLGG